MKTGTLCIVTTGDRILLGMKKGGFGAGRWNGFGGKVRDGEAIEAAAIHELQEEAGIRVAGDQLEKKAVLTFYFAGKPEWLVHVFRVDAWPDEPKETAEMRPQWHLLSEIPYSEMWEADRHWLPLVLAGKEITADIFYKDFKNAILEKFDWREVPATR